MKLKNIIIIVVLIIIFIIFYRNQVHAKYVIEYRKKVANIYIEKEQEDLASIDIKKDNTTYNIINYGTYNTKTGWDLERKEGEVAGSDNVNSEYQIDSIAYWINDDFDHDFIEIEPLYKINIINERSSFKKFILKNNKKYLIKENQKNNFICGMKIKLKDYNKYSVVYQILNKKGWMNTASDGEKTKNINEPLIGFRIKIVDKDNKQNIIESWNKDINSNK